MQLAWELRHFAQGTYSLFQIVPFEDLEHRESLDYRKYCIWGKIIFKVIPPSSPPGPISHWDVY